MKTKAALFSYRPAVFRLAVLLTYRLRQGADERRENHPPIQKS